MSQNEMPAMKNNSKRLEEEWEVLDAQNTHLKSLILDLDKYAYDRYQKNLVITMIYRTNEEQDNIYKDDERYKKKKFKSPHQFFQGVDIRSSIFNEDEIKDLVNYLNTRYNDSNYYKYTAKCHNVGLGDHFHIQYYKLGKCDDKS